MLHDVYRAYCSEMECTPSDDVLAAFPRDTECEALDVAMLENVDLAAHAPTVFPVLGQCTNVQVLDLTNTKLNDAGIRVMVEHLKALPSLTSLSVATNVGVTDADPLVELLLENRALQHVEVDGCGLAEAGAEEVLRLAAKNLVRAQSARKPKLAFGGRVPHAPAHSSPSPAREEEDSTSIRTRAVLAEHKARNLQLCDDLVNHETRSLRLLDTFREAAAQRRKEMEQRHTESETHRSAFIARLSDTPASLESKCDDERVTTTLGLDIAATERDALEARYMNTNSVVLDSVIATAIAAVSDSDGQAGLNSQLRHAKVLQEEQQIMEHLSKLVELSKTTVSVESIMTKVRQLSSRKSSLEIELDGSVTALRVSMEQNNLAAANGQRDRLLNTYEELISVVQERLALLGSDGVCRQLKDGNDSSRSALDEGIGRTFAANSDLHARIAGDLERLSKRLKEERMKREEEHMAAKKTENTLTQALSANARSQDAAWESVLAELSKLHELGKERVKINDELMDVHSHQVHLNGELDALARVGGQHGERLTKLQQSVQATLSILGGLKRFVSATATSVDNLVNDIRDKTAAAALDEQRSYLAIFGEYYGVLGDALFSREKQKEELDKTCRHFNFQIGVAKETLDPAIESHQARLEEARAALLVCEEKIEALRQRGDEQYEMFEPTERALEDNGDEFLKPCIAMEAKIADRRRAFNKLRHSYLDEDNRWIENEDAECEKVIRRVADAKKTNLSSLINPLHPRSPPRGTAGASASPHHKHHSPNPKAEATH